MKRVRCIRHGESAANAGGTTSDHASIPLTETGREQARQVARSIHQRPELIVVSPYLRARSTAEATTSAFPTVPLETWPIEEFTYLDPVRCKNTTLMDRKDWVDTYWAMANPSFIDGQGAESFLDFVGRARSFLMRLATHPAQEILAFSHGQFLNAVAWLIKREPLQIDSRAMIDWREFEIANHIPNGSGYQISYAQDMQRWEISYPDDEDAPLTPIRKPAA